MVRCEIPTIKEFRLQDFLNNTELTLLANPTSLESRAFYEKNLTQKQKEMIKTGAEDEIIIAIMENMIRTDFDRFLEFRMNCFVDPENKEWNHNYIVSQAPWLKIYEECAQKEYGISDLGERVSHTHRWRVFYAIKHPERMIRQYDEEFEQILKMIE